MSELYHCLQLCLRMPKIGNEFTEDERDTLVRFAKTNAVADLPAPLIEKLRTAIDDRHGSAKAGTFDTKVRRLYVAHNLRKHAEQLKPAFAQRSWDAWLSELRGMSQVSIAKIQNMIDVDVTQRPEAGDPTDAQRFRLLVQELESEEFKDKVAAFAERVDILHAENRVSFCIGDDTVDIVARTTKVVAYHVYLNNTAVKHCMDLNVALHAALDELKDVIQGKLKVKKAPKSRAVAEAPTLDKGKIRKGVIRFNLLLTHLKSTDTDDWENFSDYTVDLENQIVSFYDECGELALTLSLSAQDEPFVLKVHNAPKDFPTSATAHTPSLALAEIAKLLSQLEDEDEDDEDDSWEDAGDDEDEDEDEYVPPKQKSKPKAEKTIGRKVARNEPVDTDEKSLFSAFMIERCPNLADIDKFRAQLLDGTDDDQDECPQAYYELAAIGTHPLTLIMAEYWASSFSIDMDGSDDEPEYTVSCSDFRIRLTTQFVEVQQHHEVRETLCYRRDMNGSVEDKLNWAAGYFRTWGHDRTQDMLRKTGFLVSEGDILRNENAPIAVRDVPANPDAFFEEDRGYEILQVEVDETAFSLYEFLNNGLSHVRGVEFDMDEDEDNYTLSFEGIRLNLHRVGRSAEDNLFVASNESTIELFDGLSGSFDIDALRNRGMVVRHDAERITLIFGHNHARHTVYVFK